MLLASFGPVLIVLPSPTSSSIDHIVVLPPVLVCWNWLLPVAVEERSEEEDFKFEVANQHGSCDLLRVGLNDLEILKISKSFEPALNKSHDYAVAFCSSQNYISFFSGCLKPLKM